MLTSSRSSMISAGTEFVTASLSSPLPVLRYPEPSTKIVIDVVVTPLDV